jgi:hypothetical protein
MGRMGAHCLDQAWLASWRDEVDRALEPFLTAFEGRYGYPPGENRITSPGDDQTARKISARPDIAVDLTSFLGQLRQAVMRFIATGEPGWF